MKHSGHEQDPARGQSSGPPASALLPSVTLTALGAPAPGEPDSHDSGHLRGSAWCQTIFVHVRGPALVGAEDVPALVELKVAVPHLKPAGWRARAVSFVYPFRRTGRYGWWRSVRVRSAYRRCSG